MLFVFVHTSKKNACRTRFPFHQVLVRILFYCNSIFSNRIKFDYVCTFVYKFVTKSFLLVYSKFSMSIAGAYMDRYQYRKSNKQLRKRSSMR